MKLKKYISIFLIILFILCFELPVGIQAENLTKTQNQTRKNITEPTIDPFSPAAKPIYIEMPLPLGGFNPGRIYTPPLIKYIKNQQQFNSWKENMAPAIVGTTTSTITGIGGAVGAVTGVLVNWPIGTLTASATYGSASLASLASAPVYGSAAISSVSSFVSLPIMTIGASAGAGAVAGILIGTAINNTFQNLKID